MHPTTSDFVVAPEGEITRVVKAAKVVKDKVALVWKNVDERQDDALSLKVRDLPGRTYLRSKKINVVDLSKEVVDFLFAERFLGLDEVEAAYAALLAAEAAERARKAAAIEASKAQDTDREVALSQFLYGYQKAGVEYVLDHADGRAIIGDEMGLGKSIQAIAAIEDADAYPAMVACPPHLVRNWVREFGKFNPQRKVVIAKGVTPDPATIAGADVVVIGYAVLSAWVGYRVGDPLTGDLLFKNVKSVVFDEAHYLKNDKSSRAKAAHALAQRLDPSALRLALTGTAVLNRADEILSLIEVIGRWKEFGSKAEFFRTYVEGTSQETLEGLNERLRSLCYVRRLKCDVLPDLPAKRRVDAYCEAPADIARQYERAAKDVIAFLLETAGEKKASFAARAQALVRLNLLRRLAGQAKVEAAVEWAEEFVGNSERSLVVFATHKDVQDGIYDGLVDAGVSVARVHGDDNDTKVETEIARFQAKGARVIVCGLKKAGTGITLTAASDVLIVEQDWTPANLNQAEDRVHRIGQEESVMATHLVVDLPIDEHLRSVVARKQVICDAVNQGQGSTEELTEGSVMDEVIDLLTGRKAS
jgi:SNF2 family DNA or RNA helicase